MKSFVKPLVLLLAAAMLLPGCSSGNSGAPATTAAAETNAPAVDTTPVETTTDRSQVRDNLPEALNFNGETIGITYRGNENFAWELVAEDTGDVVESAIYDRNLAVEERLGIKLKPIAGDADQSKYMDNVRTAILAGSADFDVVAGAQYKAAQMVMNNCWRNLVDAKYLDFDQPWWDTGYMENVTFDPNQIYMLAGDLSLTKIEWTACMYFNKNVYQNALGDPDDLYRLVLDGGWTLDKLSEMCTKAYQDLNGNGVKDEGDLMGMWLTSKTHMDRITFSMGVRYSERGEDGYPKMVFNNERTVRYVEQIMKFFHENPGTVFQQGGKNTFKDGTALFDSNTLKGSRDYREADFEYGILPWTKLDEEQEDYYSGVQDNIALYMIPSVIADDRAEMLSAVLEAMGAENYRKVTHAYYETALKFKYSDGALYSSVVDLIHNSATTDIVYVYNYALNNVATMLRDMVVANDANIASAYAAIETSVNAGLQKIIDYYKEQA